MTPIVRVPFNAARSLLEKLGLSMRPIATGNLLTAGLVFQWSKDLPGTTRGTVVEREIDGKRVSFFIVNEFDAIQREHLVGRFFEEEELEQIAKYFDGGVFVDVGANVGNHAIYALQFLNASKVIAFEPNPPAAHTLSVNVRLNDATDRVTIHRVGLSDAAGVASFETRLNNLGATRLTVDGEGATLKLVRGDDILRDEKVDFLKIDTEGLELQVLEGLRETISRNRPIMLVEVETENRPAFEAYCAEYGYRIAWTYARWAVNINYLMVPEDMAPRTTDPHA